MSQPPDVFLKLDMTCTHSQSQPWTLEIVKRRLICPSTIHLRRDLSRSVAELPEGLIIKYGTLVHVGEGIAMRMVASKTTLPVPQIISMFVDSDRRTYILETKLPGIRLAEALSEMDKEMQINMAEEIHRITASLTQITPQDELSALLEYIEQPGSVQLPDVQEKVSLLASSDTREGLIGRLVYSIGFFTRFQLRTPSMCSAKTTEEFILWWAEIGGGAGRRLYKLHSPNIDFSIPLLFSHGNLDVENILVSRGTDAASGDWKVTGVIDWECAGWYPYFFDDWHTIFRCYRYASTGWHESLQGFGLPCKQYGQRMWKAETNAHPAVAFGHIFNYAEING